MDYPLKLSERIFLLGNHYLSTYLIMGDRSSILIDPGISSTATQVIDQIKSLGIASSNIDKLILTHAHADHVAGAPVLKKAMPGLIVSSSAETVRLLKKEKVRDIFGKDDLDISSQLKSLGEVNKSENVSDNLNDLIDETICPGQVIDLAGITIEVIDAPGHCLGGLAFWETEEKVLFCSDYLGFLVPPDQFVPNFYANFMEYMTTFESLTKLNPHWICPGHCGAYADKDAIRFMDRSRAEIDWIYHRVFENDRSSILGDKALLGELFNRYFIREATMFSEESTRYCMQLLVRRILNANGFLDTPHQRDEK